ncbi:hypothetical protein KY290_033660 [Solanum tuberosum]|uniref:Uncharacterized protein n=1 Tax=Solanum tuberosum TaxID=4113 RepID=A0ABQ7U0Z4_SOLTU|nr:hypothetical protein KY289_033030 [Solanum tuberosum]KAH0647673.1 hypothetical protein KY285_032921 [Solanum tuberosum]KAH0740617.1 hypothetical protein KY290_033660 [Solanum tuberosum]
MLLIDSDDSHPPKPQWTMLLDTCAYGSCSIYLVVTRIREASQHCLVVSIYFEAKIWKACVKRLHKEYRALRKGRNLLDAERAGIQRGSCQGPLLSIDLTALQTHPKQMPCHWAVRHSKFSTKFPGESVLASLHMDNSPITGSVTTVVAEKEKLAKASLAFNCKRPEGNLHSIYDKPTLRKLLVSLEKYEQQQFPSQPLP